VQTREFGFRSLKGDFRFVFIGRVKQDINHIDLPLYSHAYLFNDLKSWRTNVEQDVKTCQRLISRYQQNLTEQSTLEAQVIESIKLTARRLEQRADISARVVIMRPGEFILSHLKAKNRDFFGDGG
jgi:hypothetical protein